MISNFALRGRETDPDKLILLELFKKNKKTLKFMFSKAELLREGTYYFPHPCQSNLKNLKIEETKGSIQLLKLI